MCLYATNKHIGVAMLEQDRLTAMARLIRLEKISNQTDLKEKLYSQGYTITQSSISRDLKKLGVVKVDGQYKTPSIALGESNKVDRLDAASSGDNMTVLRTGPGNANRAAVVIDKAKIPGIIGTIAGDDTIFCAVGNRQDQARVMKKIFTRVVNRNGPPIFKSTVSKFFQRMIFPQIIYSKFFHL